MDFLSWCPYYLKISDLLSLDLKRDFLCSFILSGLIENKNNKSLLYSLNKISKIRTIIIGAGPSIEDKLIQDFILSNSNSFVIAADGATELCLKIGVIPNLIVTDLDGNIESILGSETQGSIVVVHAHGDNIVNINNFVPCFSRILGTTQSFPLKNVYNYGGFTDGDRCVFLADAFYAPEIWLVGMDFDSSIGYYSKKKLFDSDFKRKKLSIGKYLIEVLVKRSKSRFLNITTSRFNSRITGIDNYILT